MIRELIVTALEVACGLLDRAPTWEHVDGRLRYFHGGWGCRIGLAQKSYALDRRWGLGHWDSYYDGCRP